VLTSVSYSVSSAVIAVMSGAPLIMGADSRPYGFDVARHAYSLVMPASPDQTGPAVEHNLEPLRAIGLDVSNTATVMVPAPEEREAADRILAERAVGESYWMLHPGAGKTENLWPTRRFAEVARRVAAAGRRLLVLQGPADGPVMAEFAAGLADAPLDTFDGGDADAGEITVLPVVKVGVCAALLERADRFLCNDTGIMHVAGAVGAPTVALFGPTDPALWAPPDPRLIGLRQPSGRLEDLDVDTVWRTWRDMPGRAGEG